MRDSYKNYKILMEMEKDKQGKYIFRILHYSNGRWDVKHTVRELNNKVGFMKALAYVDHCVIIGGE